MVCAVHGRALHINRKYYSTLQLIYALPFNIYIHMCGGEDQWYYTCGSECYWIEKYYRHILWTLSCSKPSCLSYASILASIIFLFILCLSFLYSTTLLMPSSWLLSASAPPPHCTCIVCVCPHLIWQRVQWEVEWTASSSSTLQTTLCMHISISEWVMVHQGASSWRYLRHNSCIPTCTKYVDLCQITIAFLSCTPLR